MSLSAVSIRRPVLAIVMSIAIMLFGFIGFTYLGVREYPSVDPPIITVSATYVGANADVIESQITEPLEESISGIEGVRSIKSTSAEGRSNITVEFELGVDLEAAANDVRDKVSRAVRLLPPDAENPIVLKADADAIPIVFLNIKSDKRDLLQLSEIATNVFKERMQTIPGVSEVQVWGEKRYAMRLWMDPNRLASYRLTPLDVRSAVLRENVELPSGRIEGTSTELTVRTQSRLVTPEDFNTMIISEVDGRVVRFRDVGNAELGPENLRTILRRDGIPMVGIVLIPRSGANYIAIVDEFYRRVEAMKRDLPPDLQLGLGFDVDELHPVVHHRSRRDGRPGVRAGLPGDLLLPARPADHDYPHDRGAGLADRRVLHHVRDEFLDQRADAAGDRAGHRPRRRRRHRHAGEHLREDRGGFPAP